MENNFNNKDFEQFLKQNANQYRMYPSEKVWKGISNAIHSRRRWVGFGLTLLTITIISVTWVMLSTPSSKVQTNPSVSEIITPAKPEAKPEVQLISPAIKPANNSISFIPFLNTVAEEYSSNEIDDIPENVSLANHEQENEITSDKNPFAEIITTPLYGNESEQIKTKTPPVQFTGIVIDNDPDLSNFSLENKKIDNEIKKISLKDNLPWTIESVLNSYRPKAKRKVLMQVYASPTISYRKLGENKSFLTTAAISNNSGVGSLDVNNAVTHKPAIGLELGLSAKYPVAKNFKVKGGLQFNVSRYDIKAFTFNGEVATIALDDGGGVNSVYRWTKYRNFDGYSSNWLQNFYFSVSAPIGAELQIAGNKKTSFGIAGTVQPTYVLREKAYLISTDFKNYIQVPWLIRRWNVNTSFETFVNYSSGNIKWQIGPQVRYQLMSSFQNKYPVKENLFDFGLKVGIMLNQ